MFFELFVLGTFWFWVLLVSEFLLLIFLLEKERYIAAPVSLVVFLGLLVVGGSGLGDVVRWVYLNPFYTIGIFIGYFLFGTLYVVSPYIGKWWWFVRDVRDHNRDEKQQWLSSWKTQIANLKNNIENLTERIKRYNQLDRQTGGKIGNPEQIEQTEGELANCNAQLLAWAESSGNMTEALIVYWKEYEKTSYFYDIFGRRISIEKPIPSKFQARITAWIVYWPPSLFWTLLNDPIRRIGRLIYEGVADTLKKISDSAWKDEDKLS